MDFIRKGRDNLLRGAWEEARDDFEEALRHRETAEALEELAIAAWWLNDESAAISSRERAFILYKDEGNIAGAARVAVWVALDYVEFRGEEAVANGWLQRARRMLENLPLCPEQGLLKAVTAHNLLMSDKDPSGALALAREASAIGRILGDADIQMISTAIEGLALVSEGDVTQGMQLLDEAAATATTGESQDINLAASTCCYLIAACERIRDYGRAAQWCEHVREFCRRWQFSSMFATCRTQYASLLIMRGNWAEAEKELVAATDELTRYRPGLVAASTVRLAELRRRQGRWNEASSLFAKVDHHLLSSLGRGMMALDQGDPATAVDFAERFLRRMSGADRTERVPGLELLVRARTRTGDIEQARMHVAELTETAKLVPTPPMRAAALNAGGFVDAATEAFDSALAKFEDAVDLYTQTNMPFEAGRARREMARVLVQLEKISRAEQELRAALDQLRVLGAAWESGETEAALASLKSFPVPGSAAGDLTAREKEVLCLVALGRTNEEIAAGLFLSIRTVERHISNIYQKIGASGTASRAVATAWAMKHLRDIPAR